MNSPLFKYIFLPLILVFATVAMVIWVIMPLYDEVKNSTEFKDQALNNLGERKKLSENLARLIGQYKEREGDFALLDKSIPVGQSVPELLINLEAIASENGLVFTSVDFKPRDVKGDGIRTIEISIEIKGSYVAFKNYLKALETSLRIFDVLRISFAGIASGEGNANPNETKFSLTVNTYFQ